VVQVTNARNILVGNAASGGWAGFAFPTLAQPIKLHRSHSLNPASRETLRFEGNSAHSSGFYWHSAGQIYVGGKLWHPYSSGHLRYNPCRTHPARSGRTRFDDTKVFLGRGVGVSHWGNEPQPKQCLRTLHCIRALFSLRHVHSIVCAAGNAPELVGFEAHDLALSAAVLGNGWLANGLVRCRTGALLQPPCDTPGCEPAALAHIEGSGFGWYDVSQAHVVVNVTFRNCGAGASATEGCGDGSVGCHPHSSVWLLMTHSDWFVVRSSQP
jgi:hypothetical protein